MGAARRVLLSHTAELRQYPIGQKSFISAAEAAVARAGDAVVDMAYFTAQPSPSAEACRRAVLAADIYVLIAGFHFGSPVVGRPDISHTELEYEIAEEAGKPRFAFLLSKKATGGDYELFNDENPSEQADQEAFRQRVGNELAFTEFTNPDQLETCLYQALREQASEQSASGSPDQPGVATATTLRDLAGPAQQRLQDLLTLLQRTKRVLEQVDHSGAKPTGMDEWESFADQDRKHEQLAAALTDPAEDLKRRSERVLQTAVKAGEYVRQLSAPHFAKRVARLAPIVRTVSELDAISGELAGKAAAMRDDLTDRAEDYPEYRAPRDALRDANDSIDEARENVTWMRQALDRLQQTLEAGKSSRAGPAGPEPSQRISRTRGTVEKSGAIPVPIKGKAAANPDGATNTQDQGELWIPEDYARRGGVFAVLVDGDSMSGNPRPEDDIDAGEFVIVDPTQQTEDGQIAVVRMGGPEDTKHLVKRVRQTGGQLQSLESSNPKYPPLTGQDLDGAEVEGKVIGVFRPIG
jgi:SOS-response transcriptional repressor LexA